MKISQQVTIKVAEPWNFTSQEGDNIFSGVVIDYTNSVNGEAFLIKNHNTFIVSGTSVNYIVAMYRNKSIDCKKLNIAYIPDDSINQFKKLDIIKDKLKFIIIGSLA
jgi:ribosomal protein L19